MVNITRLWLVNFDRLLTVFGKPAGRDMRGLPSQVPFRRDEIFEWSWLLECFWICYPKSNRGDGWFLASLRGEMWEGFPLKSLFEETGLSNEIDYQNAVGHVIRSLTGMVLGFWQACGERYERASLSSPFLKKRGSRMKSVIQMPLNRWSDR